MASHRPVHMEVQHCDDTSQLCGRVTSFKSVDADIELEFVPESHLVGISTTSLKFLKESLYEEVSKRAAENLEHKFHRDFQDIQHFVQTQLEHRLHLQSVMVSTNIPFLFFPK